MASAKCKLARCLRRDDVEAGERGSGGQRPWAGGIDIAAAKHAGHPGAPTRRERPLDDPQHRVPHDQRDRLDLDGVLVDARKTLA